MKAELLNRPTTRMLAAISVAMVFAPVFVQAQKLETVRNEALDFSVDLPGGSWLVFSTEESSTSVNGLKGAAVVVGPFQMPAMALEQIKGVFSEQASRSEDEISVEEIDHPVGPAIHVHTVGKKGDQRQVKHSYYIDGVGKIYSIDCSSKVTTNQDEQGWDELCQAVLDSFELI